MRSLREFFNKLLNLNKEKKVDLIMIKNDLDSVRSDLGSVKNDLGSVKNDLDFIKTLLKSDNIKIIENEKNIYYLIRLLEEAEKTVRKCAINEWNSLQMPTVSMVRLMILLTIKDIEDSVHAFCRIGRDFDGGYVMYDDFDSYNVKIAYSFGINDDVSWDKDMAKKCFNIFMYDHTIKALPEENEFFHYFHLGIGDKDDCQRELMSLQTILQTNGHENVSGMILKMDVEGAEWSVLSKISSSILKQFKQIVIEFHNLNQPELYSDICLSLEKINLTHQLVHIHANNYRLGVKAGKYILPDVLEATYLNRDLYKFKDSTKSLPVRQDMPNDKECPDIILGNWNKFN